MAGRALRRHASLPFKQIVQCAQTRHPFPRTAAPAEQYLWAGEGQWRSLKANRQLDAMSRRMQSLIAASPASLPKMLQQPPGARRATSRWDWRRNPETELVA